MYIYIFNGRLLLRSARSVLAAYRQLAYKHLSPTLLCAALEPFSVWIGF